MDLRVRALRHAALGDERRLLIVDQLAVGDRTVAELGELVGMGGNLLAHHLDVLDDAGLIDRHVSEGDHRRRYVSLRLEEVTTWASPFQPKVGNVVFVCTHNSARSQFAAALWQRVTGSDASSAGTEPAERVHPKAIQVAAELGVDISMAVPAGYESLGPDIDVLISVCDKANEAVVPNARERLHWSIPDPVMLGTLASFRSAFDKIARRIEYLAPVERA